MSAPSAADEDGTSPDENVQCVLDRTVVNGTTIREMNNIGLSFFASLCGRNRGAFVVDPPDHHTYSCVSLPADLASRAGVDESTALRADLTDANSILARYNDGTFDSSQLVNVLDELVKDVYVSSADVDASPYGCDVSGLATLDCDGLKSEESRPKKLPELDGKPIRSVTLDGVFVAAPWATGGREDLTVEEAASYYNQGDFHDMKRLGLNVVHIPVPLGLFAQEGQDVDGSLSMLAVLDDYVSYVQNAGLLAIISLLSPPSDGSEATPSSDSLAAVTRASVYATDRSSAILGLVLPFKSSDAVSAARSVAKTLPLFLPINGGDLLDTYAPKDGLGHDGEDDNVYAAMEMGHSLTIADVASSNSEDDRLKMFYHESVACVSRSPIEYMRCYHDLPVFVYRGFDLGIDDCVNRAYMPDFKDYGQCDRFDETVKSGWWHRHRLSFAERQMFSYERGLGWSYAAWKLFDEGDGSSSNVIDSPEKLLSLRDVAAAGLFPSLLLQDDLDNVALACLNAPEADFVMGDRTYAPIPAPPPPPPDCGYGWWNFTTLKCDYWIPPPPTPSPTCYCPPPPPLSTSFAVLPDGRRAGVEVSVGRGELAAAFVGGCVSTLVVVGIVSKFWSKRNAGGYSTIP